MVLNMIFIFKVFFQYKGIFKNWLLIFLFPWGMNEKNDVHIGQPYENVQRKTISCQFL